MICISEHVPLLFVGMFLSINHAMWTRCSFFVQAQIDHRGELLYHPDDFDEDCEDHHEWCRSWARLGECNTNSKYMHKNCARSCRGGCISLAQDDNNGGDDNDDDDDDGDEDEDDDTPNLPHLRNRGADMGVPQDLLFHDGTIRADITYQIAKARNYMESVVPRTFDRRIQTLCHNKHPECAYWAMKGGCEINPVYMGEMCGPMCASCGAIAFRERCPLNWDLESPAWEPGDLNALFERLTTTTSTSTSDPWNSQYAVEILSSPKEKDGEGPWIITMDNIVSEKEAARLIELGGELGYERSFDVGEEQPDGTFDEHYYQGRTSTNAWCDTEECELDPHVQAVNGRLSEMVHMPLNNSEGLQLLRYEEGQFYTVHHDYTAHQQFKQGGPRILTVFLYLNTVETGGGTHFDQLNITIQPKRGRAVLWPSVLNEDPYQIDPRTSHQALPAEQGLKFAANAWFHLRDFRTPDAEGCMG